MKNVLKRRLNNEITDGTLKQRMYNEITITQTHTHTHTHTQQQQLEEEIIRDAKIRKIRKRLL